MFVAIASCPRPATMCPQLNIVSRVWEEFRLVEPPATCFRVKCSIRPFGKIPLPIISHRGDIWFLEAVMSEANYRFLTQRLSRKVLGVRVSKLALLAKNL